MIQPAAMERFLDKYGRLLYAALFAGVLVFRLAGLQAAPLSEKEAAEAWGAYNLLHGDVPGSSALYSAFTACLFFIGGAAVGLARLLPALAGSALVLLPGVFRGSRTRLEAALFAVLIACSPGVTALSAQAGGGALGLLAAAVWLFYSRHCLEKESVPIRWIAGGALLGLAIAAGSLGWSGLAIALIASGADRLVWKREAAGATPEPVPELPAGGMIAGAGLPGLLAGLLLGGTGLLFFPRALGAFAAGLAQWAGAFFSGWPPIGEFLLLLAAYEPIALLFGIAGIVIVLSRTAAGEDRFWALFTAATGIWILLRPAAFPDETLWLILPLLRFAAFTIAWLVNRMAEQPRRWEAVAQMAACWVSLTAASISLGQYIFSGNGLFFAFSLLAVVLGWAGIPILLRSLEDRMAGLWVAGTAAAAVGVLALAMVVQQEALCVIPPVLLFAAGAFFLYIRLSRRMTDPRLVTLLVLLGLSSLVAAVAAIAEFSITGSSQWLAYSILAVALGPVLAPMLERRWADRWRAALTGYALAGAAALLVFQAGSGIHLASDRRASANELWWRQTAPAEIGRLRATLDDLSNRETGMPGSLDVLVQAPRESALEWALLDYPAAAFTDDPSGTGTTPAMVLAPRMERDGVVVSPQLAGDYRGQEFAVGEKRAWEGLPPYLLNWWLQRDGKVLRKTYVLWVREDLFPDSGK